MNDILAYPEMLDYLKTLFQEDNLEMIPKAMYHLPLAYVEQHAVCSWGVPFSAVIDQLLAAVDVILDILDHKSRRCISLWNERCDWTPAKSAGGKKESVFLLSPTPRQERFLYKKSKRPAVIICPGGAYERVCFSGEGNPVLQFMEAKGYGAFVLNYRVAPNAYPAPQEDLALAIRYVRNHAEEYEIDPENLMLMGFSAGGHLCASMGALYHQFEDTSVSLRPNKICLGYPVISCIKECHEDSVQNLTNGDETLKYKLSVERLVTPDYPKTFLWTCADDSCVPPSNSVRFAKALETAGVLHQFELYPAGEHGCNLAFATSAAGWSQEMIQYFHE
jgi:acetyl esterase/lipase